MLAWFPHALPTAGCSRLTPKTEVERHSQPSSRSNLLMKVYPAPRVTSLLTFQNYFGRFLQLFYAIGSVSGTPSALCDLPAELGFLRRGQSSKNGRQRRHVSLDRGLQ